MSAAVARTRARWRDRATTSSGRPSSPPIRIASPSGGSPDRRACCWRRAPARPSRRRAASATASSSSPSTSTGRPSTQTVGRSRSPSSASPAAWSASGCAPTASEVVHRFDRASGIGEGRARRSLRRARPRRASARARSGRGRAAARRRLARARAPARTTRGCCGGCASRAARWTSPPPIRAAAFGARRLDDVHAAPRAAGASLTRALDRDAPETIAVPSGRSARARLRRRRRRVGVGQAAGALRPGRDRRASARAASRSC